MSLDARQAALDAWESGLSVLPPKEDGSKAPDGQWLYFQQHRASLAQINSWYGIVGTPLRSGCGLVCGAVSGNLECFEFDSGGRLYEHYKATARALGHGDLIDRLDQGYLEQSPSGGYHWLYRCDVISGNTKLAVAADKQSLIETRGEGGYIIVAPSNGKVHKEGAYKLLNGGFASIPRITPEERLTLWDIARLFDEPIVDRADPWVMKYSSIGNTAPWDEYNARTTWRDLLVEHGWTHVFTRDGVQYWRRPGKDHSHSATVNFGGSDRLKCFSSSCEFDNSPGVTYSRFGAYAVWEHGGDWKAAVKAIRQQVKTEKLKPKPPPEGTKFVICLKDVEPKEINWLWKERIPKGFITIFFGTTGVGKSFVALDIAARLTRGDVWPDSQGECCEVGNVLIVSEDPFEYVLTPRLIELGAVMSKVYAMTWETMQTWVLDDVITLGHAFDQSEKPSLIIIDPPTNFLGDIDEHKNSKVRAALMQLVIWLNSRESPVACVLITHCKKPTSENLESIYQMIGSVAWGSTARIGHALITDPDDKSRKLFVCSKSNLGEIPKGYAYRIVKAGRNAKVEWIIEVDVNADDVMDGENVKSVTVDAAEWLMDRFREYREWFSKDLEQIAEHYGISHNAVFKNKVIRGYIKEGKIRIKRDNSTGAPRYKWIAQADWPPKKIDSAISPETSESTESSAVSPSGVKEKSTFGLSPLGARKQDGPESKVSNLLPTFGSGSVAFGSDSGGAESKVEPYETTTYGTTFGTFGTFGSKFVGEEKIQATRFVASSLMYGEVSRTDVEEWAKEKGIGEPFLLEAAVSLGVEKTLRDGKEFWWLRGPKKK